MNKIIEIIQVIVFFVLIIGMMFVMLITPDRDFSPQENRMLSAMPSCSLNSFKSGEWMKKVENYLSDQFPGRDGWIGLKSYMERMTGKTENNQVFFAKKDTLITKYPAPDPDIVENNIKAVNALAEHTDIPVYFSLIPGAVCLWKDKLPDNAQNYDQEKLIRELYANVSCPVVDNFGKLQAHKEEGIYYRTDHHWTTRGAYYGYQALCDAFGLTPKKLEEYPVKCVSNDFYGTVYSSSGVKWVKPDRIERYVPETGKTVRKIMGDDVEDGLFYDEEKLQTKDQYRYFFGGNTALLKITSHPEKQDEKLKRLLVIRDSYSDCEMPFLTDHFSEIYLMDLRYYRFGVQFFLEQYPVDAILINYSVANFGEDRNIVIAGN